MSFYHKTIMRCRERIGALEVSDLKGDAEFSVLDIDAAMRNTPCSSQKE